MSCIVAQMSVGSEIGMVANAVARARVDQRVKDEASAILGAAGLTVSDAFRMMEVITHLTPAP